MPATLAALLRTMASEAKRLRSTTSSGSNMPLKEYGTFSKSRLNASATANSLNPTIMTLSLFCGTPKSRAFSTFHFVW